jgi:DNA-binding MarR family transcriptional regulator
MSTLSQGSGGSDRDVALAHVFAAFGPAYKRWTKMRLSELEIGYTHVRALHLLQCKGPQIMSGLSSDLGITPRYVTVLVDHMEAEGLVERARHPSDRRATLIRLTDAGEEACGAAGHEHVEAAAELLQVLSPDQQDALLEAMRTLLAELQRRGVAPDPQVLTNPETPSV